MSKVTVYYFKKYHILEDKEFRSKRMTPLERIAEMDGAIPIKETAKEINISDLDSNGFYHEEE